MVVFVLHARKLRVKNKDHHATPPNRLIKRGHKLWVMVRLGLAHAHGLVLDRGLFKLQSKGL